MQAGAAGYLLKNIKGRELIDAIRAVHAGESVLHPKIARKVLNRFAIAGMKPEGEAAADLLSERELQVFHLLGSGARMQEIAAQLEVSVKTIETYRAHLIHKLNLKSGLELLQYAVQTVAERRLLTQGVGDQPHAT